MKTSTERGRRKTGHPDKTIVADIVRRVVEAAQPDKIILFGSAARGEMGPNSDIDFLVIKRERSCLARKRYPPTDPRERLNRARSNLALAKSDTVGALLEDLCFEAQQAAERKPSKRCSSIVARASLTFTTWMNCSSGSSEAASRSPNTSGRRTNFHRSPW